MALVGNISGSGGVSNTIGITGSLIIANPGLATFPTLPGNDAVFFVSGAIDGKAAGTRTVAVFGGDTVVSGSLTIGTGSITITSNEIQFYGGAAKITSSSAGLTFFDSNNTSGKTLTQLAAGSGGGGTGTNYFTETSDKVIYNSGTVAFTGARTGETITAASQKGTDVVFYFSGSTGGDATTLFGGAVVTSGSIKANGAIAADGGSITTNQATFNLVNSVTTLNVGTSAATVNIGQASNSINVAGNLDVNGTTDLAGTVTLSGNSQIVSHTGTGNLTISSANSVLVEGTTFTGDNVEIPGNLTVTGDLTVNGTTTTVNTTNLVVKDPLIYLASSSAATTVTYGGIAIASGSGTTDQALVFVKDGTGATSLWSAGRQDVQAGTATSFSKPITYMPIRASSFEMGGTAGSAVAAGSSYISSSDGLNTLINHTSTTTFTKSGTGVIKISDYEGSGEGLITGNSTVDQQTLWLSGSSLALAHSNAGNAGPNGSRIRFFGLDGSNGLEGGYVKVAGTLGNGTLTVAASSNSAAPQAMILTGSKVTIGANSGGTSNGIQFAGVNSGTPTTFSTFYLDTGGGGTATGLFSLNGTILSSLGSSSTAEFTLTGSNINLKHGAEGGKSITIQRGNSKYADIQYVSDGSRTYAQFNSNNVGSSNVRIGTSGTGPNAGNLNLSGTLVEVLAENGAIFQTRGTSTAYLTITSGSYFTPAATLLNASKIESAIGGNILLGSTGLTAISGSQVRLNVATGQTVGMQVNGAGFLNFSSGSTNAITIAAPVATTANLLDTTTTTINAFTAATTLNFATGSTSTGTYNLVTGLLSSGQTKTINIGTGGLASSTTNIVLGSTAGAGTITANENLVPGATNTYDLGAVDNRWRNIYTGDLHLKNDRGNWTIVEEAEFLSITNNLSGKRYKFVLEEI